MQEEGLSNKICLGSFAFSSVKRQVLLGNDKHISCIAADEH